MGRRVGGGRGGAGVGGRGGGSPRWKVAPQCGWVPCVVKSHTRSGTAWGAHTERRLGCTASDCGRRLRGRLREASRATLRGARGPSSALGAQRAAVRTREGALGRGWPALPLPARKWRVCLSQLGHHRHVLLPRCVVDTVHQRPVVEARAPATVCTRRAWVQVHMQCMCRARAVHISCACAVLRAHVSCTCSAKSWPEVLLVQREAEPPDEVQPAAGGERQPPDGAWRPNEVESATAGQGAAAAAALRQPHTTRTTLAGLPTAWTSEWASGAVDGRMGCCILTVRQCRYWVGSVVRAALC